MAYNISQMQTPNLAYVFVATDLHQFNALSSRSEAAILAISLLAVIPNTPQNYFMWNKRFDS